MMLSLNSQKQALQKSWTTMLPVPEHRPSVAAMRAGLRFLDDVDLCETFAQRAAVMKNIPKFLRGSFRVALRLALEEISMGFAQNDWLRQVRGWKLFLVLPRLLLHRPPRGKVGREKVSRFLKFSAGQWADLFRASQECSEQAATISRRARRRGGQRVARAMQLVQLGELSGGRLALEGADLAPGSDTTLCALRNPARRPNRPRELVEVLCTTPHIYEQKTAQTMATSWTCLSTTR